MSHTTITITPPHTQRGFSLFEVLITVVVVSVGLLGLAGLQFAGLRASNNAQDATYAMQLAQEVAERIRANRVGAISGNYSNIEITHASAITASTCGNADSTGCTWSSMRFYDVYQLYQRIKNNDGNPPILSYGAIKIQSSDNINFNIFVFWGNPSSTLPTTCPVTGAEWLCVRLAVSLA